MYEPYPPPDQVSPQLGAPAVGLIVAGALSGASALIVLLAVLFQLVQGSGMESTFEDEAQRYGYYSGYYGSIAVYIVSSVASIAAAPFVIFGGMRMMKGESFSKARTASILSMIPFTSCCCLVGVPLGIWALTVLKKPEVRASFRS